MKTKKLEEMERLLIVVDMVNGFVREGMMASKNIEHIIPEIERLVQKCKEEGCGVAFIKDTHLENAREFHRYPKHCVKGTSEAELITELQPYEEEALVYEKNSTSAIYAPNFLTDIDAMKKLKEIIIVGCCTDICDLNLAIPLQNYFDQMDRDVEIVIPKDAVETFDAPNHNSDIYNEHAFALMEQAGVQLVKHYEGGKKYVR